MLMDFLVQVYQYEKKVLANSKEEEVEGKIQCCDNGSHEEHKQTVEINTTSIRKLQKMLGCFYIRKWCQYQTLQTG